MEPRVDGDKRDDLTIADGKKAEKVQAKPVNWLEERRLYPDFAEPVGQADSPIINGSRTVGAGRLAPGYIKRDPIAWIFTHLHDAEGKNLLYNYGYLFVQTYDIPDGVNSVTLPYNDKLRIMAMSMGTAENDEIQPLQELFD